MITIYKIIPMNVTVVGIITEVRDVHWKNALSLMDVNELSIVTDDEVGQLK